MSDVNGEKMFMSQGGKWTNQVYENTIYLSILINRDITINDQMMICLWCFPLVPSQASGQHQQGVDVGQVLDPVGHQKG